jgi:hypothetical protein
MPRRRGVEEKRIYRKHYYITKKRKNRKEFGKMSRHGTYRRTRVGI